MYTDKQLCVLSEAWAIVEARVMIEAQITFIPELGCYGDASLSEFGYGENNTGER